MAPPVVQFRSVVAVLDRFPVLTGVDLDVDAGEIVLLRGGNGAGKTSLLRVMAGLLPIRSGTATVFGRDLRKGSRSIRRDVAYLGHQNFLYSELTGRENVEFLMTANVKGASSDLIDNALRSMDISSRLSETPVSRMSAGQRRRVALAALLARRPPLILLDEPHAGLDRSSRDILDAAVRMAASDGCAVVMSSHEEATSEMASREVWIEGGTTDIDLRDVQVTDQAVTGAS